MNGKLHLLQTFNYKISLKNMLTINLNSFENCKIIAYNRGASLKSLILYNTFTFLTCLSLYCIREFFKKLQLLGLSLNEGLSPTQLRVYLKTMLC